MKMGILSDAHGNYYGFKKCLGSLVQQEIDSIMYLGDAYGYFPDGNEIIDEFLSLPMDKHYLLGNHEAMLLGKLPISHAQNELYQHDSAKLSKKHLDILKSLCPAYEISIDDINVLFVHGNPNNPLAGYCYPDSSLEEFMPTKYDYIFMGHTHRAFIKKKEKTVFVNVGSCGLPRDIGNRASYCIFDTQTKELLLKKEILNIDYLLEKYLTIHPSVKDCLMRRE